MTPESKPSLTIDQWPALPLSDWIDTLDTLHMWTQMVGKIKLELTPFLNEWWNVGLHLLPRGLTTGSIYTDNQTFSIDFDFVDHRLAIQTADGAARILPLGPRSVSDFYAELMTSLADLGIAVSINTLPSEVPEPIRFEDDHDHRSYDPDAVQRWWKITAQTERILQRFRTPFYGKSSPILFYWGSFDLSHARFSGRPAEPPPGAPRFYQIAEDQENFACGFWPGNVTASGLTLGEPAFYAYLYPEPDGCKVAPIRPERASYDLKFSEFIYRYDDARATESPDDAILEFFETAYDASSRLADWPREALEPYQSKGTS